MGHGSHKAFSDIVSLAGFGRLSKRPVEQKRAQKWGAGQDVSVTINKSGGGLREIVVLSGYTLNFIVSCGFCV